MNTGEATDTAAPPAMTFPLDGRELRIGRDAVCEIRLRSVGVSREHAVIRCDADNPVVIDSDSTFGTRLDGEMIKEAALTNGSTLSIGIQNLKTDIADGYISITVIESDEDPQTHGDDKDVIRIGRDTTNDVCLPHPMVSRFHAVVKRTRGGFVITDLGSANSTYINGRAASTAVLCEGDAAHIGPFRFHVSGGKFCRADDLNKIRIEAHALSVKLKGKRLLDDVSLTIEPGAFVALLGASGAGKSTLSKVLSGQLTPTSGRLYMNGFPAAKFGAAFERGIGYVSQQILLRPELTVWETLVDQSLIRLPGDSTEKERLIRADEVLELMGLVPQRHRRVANLSGGEARRLHVGVELLASPAVVILDEPLAGLDPGLVGKFMQLFRRICDRGHTLLLITHTLDQLELCDKAVYMRDGRILFSGPPKDLCLRFGVEDPAQIYEDVSAADSKYETARHTAEQASPRLTEQHPPMGGKWVGSFRRPLRAASSFTRQTVALVSRYTKIYVRDRRNMFLLMLQTPLITLLLGLIYTRVIRAVDLPGFYFCLTVTGIWVGGLGAVREVAAELSMLSRETKCGLIRPSYVAARVFTSAALSAAQALLFAVSASAVFEHLDFSMEFLILLYAAIFAGSLLGLAVSACSGGVGRAISTLPIVLIPQIFFSGAIVPFEYMAEWGRRLSYLTISRPVFGVMKKVFLLDFDFFRHKDWTGLILLCAGMIIIFGVALRARTGRRAAI